MTVSASGGIVVITRLGSLYNTLMCSAVFANSDSCNNSIDITLENMQFRCLLQAFAGSIKAGFMESSARNYVLNCLNTTNFKSMITLIRPILFSFINSDKVKRLIVDLLTKLAEQTDNTVDDQAVAFIERGLFGGPLE